MSGFQRMTEQRRLILEALRSTTCHPTADWIYERVREKLPHISLGTIYRNLRTLVQMGEIMQLITVVDKIASTGTQSPIIISVAVSVVL